ncbi:SDR family oxidoreductase [Inquilinus sp. KBS0705]|nr:SDR family oxidoreductase [Inquilinus sp. KBS0705]
MENQGKYALITGATSGIGYELAMLFAKDKYNLIIVARDQAELQTCADTLSQEGVAVLPIACDLSDMEAAKSLCYDVQNRGIDVDVLVNDAGQGLYGLFKDTDLERELSMIHLNICATVILTKHFVKSMVARNEGKILNLASIASRTPGPWQSVYHGTKAFVLSFSEGIREELKENHITVTALLPGPTDTDFFNKSDMQDSKVVQDKSSMSDPAKVAKDGYEALMNGDDQVVSGFKNKMITLMSSITPDRNVAGMMASMQEPVDKQHHE